MDARQRAVNLMKPRNHVVLALLKCKRKSGAHIKSNKALRRANKMGLRSELN